MTVVWPHFQKLIFGLGGLVDATGYLGTLLYGFILRMLGRSVYTTSSTFRSGPPRLAVADCQRATG